MVSLLNDGLFVLAAIAYLISTLLYARFFVLLAEIRLSHYASFLMIAGVSLHAIYIFLASFLMKQCPVLGVHFPLSLLALFACCIFLILKRRYRLHALGAMVAPFSLSTMFAARILYVPEEQVNLLQNRLLPLHIMVNLVGLAFFSLAGASAFAYLIQERRLKQKKVDAAFRKLPSPDTLDRASYRFLLYGFPFLTVGILLGAAWSHPFDDLHLASLLRAAIGYVTWVVFAVVLVARSSWGLRGRRGAYGTLMGCALSFSVLIIYLLREGTSA